MSLFLPRPGELRAAEWGIQNTENALWTIPRAHQAEPRTQTTCLARHWLSYRTYDASQEKGRTAFPSLRTITKSFGKHVKCNLRRLGYVNDEGTSRGFRASAATLLNETGRWNADAIERQLSHIRAYARGEHWNESQQ
jgi:integrase